MKFLAVMRPCFFGDSQKDKSIEIWKLKYPTYGTVAWDENNKICITGKFKGENQTIVLSKEEFNEIYTIDDHGIEEIS